MTNPTNDVATVRINNLMERAAIALLILLMSMGTWTYNSHLADFKVVQTQVMGLQLDKVSRNDLREVEARINNNFDARINELISRSQNDKADILARIDLLLNRKQ